MQATEAARIPGVQRLTLAHQDRLLIDDPAMILPGVHA